MQDVKDTAQPDELMDFNHLKARRGMSHLELEDEASISAVNPEIAVMHALSQLRGPQQLPGKDIEAGLICAG